MTYQGFFDLQTVHDLFKKLEYDFSELNKEPTDQYLAFNFFVTAEHLLDWFLPGFINDKKREGLRNSDTLLKICSHIANGAKHFRAESKHHTSVSNTGNIGGFDPNAFGEGFDIARLVITLDDGAKSQIEVIDLAEKLLKFWKQKLSNP